MFSKWWPGLLALGLALPAHAGDSAAVARVRAAVQRLAPGETISDVRPAGPPGFYQVLVEGRLVYVSSDGRYVMDGRLMDARDMRDLSAEGMRAVRRKALAAVPAAQRLVFAPPHPRYTVTVFTDIDCGYCRAFQSQMAAINAEGIAVQYLFWPRTGLHDADGHDTAAYRKAVDVWCAADRRTAFVKADQGGRPTPADCSNPVASQFRLGERIGVDGTPTVIAADGTVLGGFLTAEQLLHALQSLQRQHADAGAAAEAP